MGCDIHLIAQQRTKGKEDAEWRNVGFRGKFTERIYGMFARMANVRNYWGFKYIEPRGLPEDIFDDWVARNVFCMKITENEHLAEWGDNFCSKEQADEWVAKGYSEWINETTITDPDLHSHSWLTTQELRQCFNECFKDENGEYRPLADYVRWLGLVSLCEGIESDGKHECRVVFAFDN